MSKRAASSGRVEALLASMTVVEKVGQLTQYFHFPFELPADGAEPPTSEPQTSLVEEKLAQGQVGALLFVTDPAEKNRLQKLAIDGSRHAIPALFGFDVIHGLRTIFPVPIGLAATWNEDLIEECQAIAAREARAAGIHWTFAPMVDIARDPRWGRIVEGAGEDPLLASVVAAAHVRGFQGEHLGAPGHILAGPKHFLGYGAALGGRDYDEADLSEQDIWNTYLPPFQAAIEAGAGNIMSAYMDLNGVPATGNRWLLTDVLRQTLGFTGFVVSDANAVRDLVTHHFAADATDAAVRAVQAGIDLEMATTDAAYAHLPAAIADGRLDLATLDESVRRILQVKEQLGLFEDPFVSEDEAQQVLADPTHREAACRAAEQSAVLLRNEGNLLPLPPEKLTQVAVIGPLADSRRDILGPWVFDQDPTETVTVLAGIETQLAGKAKVVFERGVAEPKRATPSIFDIWDDGSPTAPADFPAEAAFKAAIQAATNADVAILVLGEQQEMIGENASSADLVLPGEQQRLLEAMAATGTPVVLVLMSGRPLDLRWAASNIPAILEIWYPGTQGGTAVARLLFGEVAPAGRLPFTWPRSTGQIPIHHAITRSHDPENQGRRYWNEASTPLFPFGFGLSYTSFAYRSLRLDRPRVDRHGTVTVSVDITNIGGRAGIEVAQLYLHQRYGTSSRPGRQLKAFKRVELEAGETQTATFKVGPQQRRYWSSAVQDWVLDETICDIWVGPNADAKLHVTFAVG